MSALPPGPNYAPAPGYAPAPPAQYSPAPSPAPAYPAPTYAPVGPVLLKSKPYEVKSVQPLPITVSEAYSSFDCRERYPGRHYADLESGCQVCPTLHCHVFWLK